jgi:hypothetical protein
VKKKLFMILMPAKNYWKIPTELRFIKNK